MASSSAAIAKKKPVKKPANAIAKTTAFKVGVPAKMTAKYKGASRSIVVHRIAASRFVVLDTTCTHQGCQVNLNASSLKCPCHLAEFDLTDGSNTLAPSGSPQVQPLRRFSTAVKNGYLVFTS